MRKRRRQLPQKNVPSDVPPSQDVERALPTIRSQMAIFDNLPAEVRQALNDHTLTLSPAVQAERLSVHQPVEAVLAQIARTTTRKRYIPGSNVLAEEENG